MKDFLDLELIGLVYLLTGEEHIFRCTSNCLLFLIILFYMVRKSTGNVILSLALKLLANYDLNKLNYISYLKLFYLIV